MALQKPTPKASSKKIPPAAVKAAAAATPKGRPAAKPPIPAKAAAPTVTLKILAAAFAEQHELTKAAADTMLNDIMAMMIRHLKAGDRLRLGGLGILEVKSRPARMGRNPATGAAIAIKASKKVAFRAAKELKASI